MKTPLIRYGVFAILLLMGTGLLLMLQSLSVRQKVTVQLFVTGPHTAVAYAPAFPAKQGEDIVLSQTSGGDLPFRVDSICHEPNLQRMHLSTRIPNLQQALGGNTFSTGYVFQGKVSLLSLVKAKIF